MEVVFLSLMGMHLSNRFATNIGWLQCRKDYAVFLMEDRRVMVLVS